jgi:hypothetical protein
MPWLALTSYKTQRYALTSALFLEYRQLCLDKR